jgi:hypothetical protein
MRCFSTNFGAGAEADDCASTKNAPLASTVLGASGSSFAKEIPLIIRIATAKSSIDFMITSPLIGIDWEAPALFAPATGLLRSVM